MEKCEGANQMHGTKCEKFQNVQKRALGAALGHPDGTIFCTQMPVFRTITIFN